KRGADDLRIERLVARTLLVGVRLQIEDASFVSPKKVDRRIVRVSEEPRTERRRVGREAQRIERFRQSLLNDVLAVDERACKARTIAMELGANFGDEVEESLAGGCELGRIRNALHRGPPHRPYYRRRRGAAKRRDATSG